MKMVLAVLALAATAQAEPVRVRTDVAFAGCVTTAARAFTARSGQKVEIEVAEPSRYEGADLLIGEDRQMTRLLEGGPLGNPRDLGSVPWVLVAPGTGDAVTSAAAAMATGEVVLPAGILGEPAREYAQRLGAQRVRPSSQRNELEGAAVRLVPRTLAGSARTLPTPIRRLVATAAVVEGAPAGTVDFLDFLSDRQRGLAATGCLDAMSTASTGAVAYATAVADWWLPQCTLAHNLHNDPNTVVGAPDAFKVAQDRYQGMFSLGQGGYVVVDTGGAVVNGPGNDVRVYQITSSEEVTVYASASPTGPWSLLGLREVCGIRITPQLGYCEFDLANAGLSEARYLKIEDGEGYPCLAGSTATEGADIDAVALLNFR